MVEAATINKTGARAFWKNGGEVDIIHNNIPLEVKYQATINSDDFKNLREFMKKFGVSNGVMITKSEERYLNFNEGRVQLIPAWKFLLTDSVSAILLKNSTKGLEEPGKKSGINKYSLKQIKKMSQEEAKKEASSNLH